MVSAIISRLVILLFGTLYPAYASYKAVRTKNVKEYVKWMMYWIVFALFCSVETFSDVFLSWLPFYYELKIVFVLWMLSPMTQGSSFLFKKFVHPQLARREKDIDEMIDQASKQGYTTLMTLGTKGLQAMVRTAIMGQSKLVDHLRRSYSTSDLSNDGHNLVPRHEAMDEGEEEGDDELDNRLLEDNAELARRRLTKSRGSASGLSLSSVKEEDGEDGEHVITETFTIPASTKRHYSMREDSKSSMRQKRCQSLPPSTDRYTKPLVIASTSLDAKRQFFAQFQSVDKKEVQTAPLPQVSPKSSPKSEPRRQVLSRSVSYDSATRKRIRSVPTPVSGSPVESRRAMFTRSVSEGREVRSFEDMLSSQSHRMSSMPSVVDNKLKSQQPELLKEETIHSTQERGSEKLEESVMKDVDNIEMMMEEEDIILLRRSVPRFFSELPVIDETAAMGCIAQPQFQAPLQTSSQMPEVSLPPTDSQFVHKPTGNLKAKRLNLLPTDENGEDQTGIVFLDPPDDDSPEGSDNGCPTPVQQDTECKFFCGEETGSCVKVPESSKKVSESSKNELESSKDTAGLKKETEISKKFSESSKIESKSLKKEPESTKKELESSKKQPDTSEKEPESSKKEPESSKKEPKSSKKEPESSTKEGSKKEPKSSKKEPESLKKESSKKELESLKKEAESSNKESSKREQKSLKKDLESSKKETESSKTESESSDKEQESSKTEPESSMKESSEKEPESSKKESSKKESESLKKEPESPKTDPKSSKNESESLKKEPESPKTDPKSSKNESESSNKEHESSKTESESSMKESSEKEPESSKKESSKKEPESPKTDPKISKKESEISNKEQKSSKKESESSKKEPESPKKASESSKKEPESSKKESESSKKESENSLKEQESLKKESESPKKELEISKKESESSKKESKSLKTEQESSKKESESLKKEQESSKKESESLKTEQESSKKESESLKKEQESSKKEPESLKKKSESLKKEQESSEKEPKSSKKEPECTDKEPKSSERESEEIMEDVESDTSSVSHFGSLDKEQDTCSELSDSSTWETLSELSCPGSPECEKGSSRLIALKEESDWMSLGSCSAPSSPASMSRGVKIKEEEHPKSTPTSPSVPYRELPGEDEFSQVKSRVRRQLSLPATASRGISYSWPSPYKRSDSNKERSAARSHLTPGVDPYQKWLPQTSSGVPAYSSHSSSHLTTSLSSQTHSQTPDRRERSYIRSSSLDMGGGEALYGRYTPGSYRVNLMSTTSPIRPRSRSLSVGKSSTYTPGSYTSKTYPSKYSYRK